jgi:hypothetical protein
MDQALAEVNGSSSEEAGEGDGADETQSTMDVDDIPLVVRAVLTLVCGALQASGAERSFMQLTRCA